MKTFLTETPDGKGYEIKARDWASAEMIASMRGKGEVVVGELDEEIDLGDRPCD